MPTLTTGIRVCCLCVCSYPAILILIFWDSLLSFRHTTRSLVDGLVVTFFLVGLCNVIRKYVIQSVVMKFNENTYRDRIEALRFTEVRPPTPLVRPLLCVLFAISACIWLITDLRSDC